MSKLYLILNISIFSSIILAQAPDIEWQNTIGGNGYDILRSIQQTEDGGYILGGYSDSGKSGDKTEESHGTENDYWVVKINDLGDIEWQNTIGGGDNEFLHSIQQTEDGGYILGGYSYSTMYSYDVAGVNNGASDYWVVKLNELGDIEWQNMIGGDGYDELKSIQQTTDGGYILGGRSESGIWGNKDEESKGGSDYWVVKLTNSGIIEWQSTIGGSQYDDLVSIQQTNDGGYILGGYSNSGISGDKTDKCLLNYYEYWVVKLDDSGDISWEKSFGGKGNSYLFTVNQTSDDGYILGGYSDAELSCDKSEGTQGGYDYWVIKLSSLGGIVWQSTIGGSGNDILQSVNQTSDDGYILGGYSESGISGDKTDANMGNTDYWIIKLTNWGTIEWQKTIGGINSDNLYVIQQTQNGGYILGGYSESGISGDKTDVNMGNTDYWIVKLETLTDNIPPATPTITSISAFQGGVKLEWTQIVEQDLSHYNIYRSKLDGFNPSSSNKIAIVDKSLTYYNDVSNIDSYEVYYYKISAEDNTSNESEISDQATVTTLNTLNEKLATNYILNQNVPNPFNPSTTINYSIGSDSYVKIEIFDISGKLISTLQNNFQTKGWHSVVWNGNDKQGKSVPAGIYLGKLTSGNKIRTIKLMLVK